MPTDLAALDPAEAWAHTLEGEGYSHLCRSGADYRRWKRYRQVWRRVFAIVPPAEVSRVLEIGMGGGAQLMPFALNGKQCCGVDVSTHVIARAGAFRESLERYHGGALDVKFILGDWLSDDIDAVVGDGYDLVFNAGVIEHYLEEEKRIAFLAKKLRHLRPGGWLVSIVPSGIHPFREAQRRHGWGGYSVPEVDYDPQMMRDEAMSAGAEKAFVLPHRHFGYLFVKPSGRLKRLACEAAVACGGIPGAARLLPARWAATFILVAQRQ
jgi:SAM-dependent methyltransferase